MARVSVKAILDKPLARLMTPDAKRFLLMEWYRLMFQYIPFRTGVLASGMDAVEDAKPMTPEMAAEIMLASIDQQIVFRAIYAIRLYYGDDFNFSRELHPLAQARWAEAAWADHGQQIMEALKNYAIRQRSE